ncbi:MAG: BolA family transcriptional regulator [Deltaproteobacteria bacterium]|nr:BolA family transcriptional regulator [Deltaproteobacteria bacterium]MBW2540915.1 BolA family transcriptional regulator [Deltaproteobacteria bacterium]
MSDADERRARIEAELREQLAAIHVEVIDESHLHAGHAGARGGGGHFRAVVVSKQFDGKSPVERQRMIYKALENAMGSEIHALSMKTLTPAEWTSGQ